MKFIVQVFFVCDELSWVGGEGWEPEGWGPEGWGPEGWGAQNFALFFPLPPKNSLPPFLPSLGVFSWILVVFEALGHSNVHVWSSRVVMLKPPGFHTTAREPKRAHLRVLVFKTPPKINEKTPREGRKERILRRERGKKERNFGRSREGRSWEHST